MTIIYSREQFDATRPYKNSPLEESKYPSSYPVIVGTYIGGGGLMGEYTGTVFVYPPKNLDLDKFYEGFKKGWELCQEYNA